MGEGREAMSRQIMSSTCTWEWEGVEQFSEFLFLNPMIQFQLLIAALISLGPSKKVLIHFSIAFPIPRNLPAPPPSARVEYKIVYLCIT